MIKLQTFKERAKRHLNKRKRISKFRNPWAWYAKLYLLGERQFRFVEEMEKIKNS